MPIPCEELFQEYTRLDKEHEAALEEYISVHEPAGRVSPSDVVLEAALSRLRLLEQAASDAYARWIECVESRPREM